MFRYGSHVGRLPAREPTPKSSHPLPITQRRRLRFSEVPLFLLRVLCSFGPHSFALPNVSSDPHYVSAAYLSCTLILVGEIPLGTHNPYSFTFNMALTNVKDVYKEDPVIHPRLYSREGVVRSCSKFVYSTRSPRRCLWWVLRYWRRSSTPLPETAADRRVVQNTARS